MVYIHGINHNAQIRGDNGDPANADRLEAVVRGFCDEKRVAVIAEEYSIEGCKRYSVEESICCAIAREYGLVHVYCDPTADERERIGIPSPDELNEQVTGKPNCSILTPKECGEIDRLTAEHFPKREQFWAEKLVTFRGQDLLFVCGKDHVESFGGLLRRCGWEVQAECGT